MIAKLLDAVLVVGYPDPIHKGCVRLGESVNTVDIRGTPGMICSRCQRPLAKRGK